MVKKDGWYPWLDDKISDNNNQVIRFDMPDTDYSRIDVWVNELDKYVDNLDENQELRAKFLKFNQHILLINILINFMTNFKFLSEIY